MKEKDLTRLRSFAVVGHSQSGKTSLVDTIFYNAGESDRWGKVDEGSSFSDYFEEEKERRTTIHSKVFRFDKNNHSLFVMDTPGYNDFFGEVVGALRGVDIGVVVVDAVSGVQVQTTKVMRVMEKQSKPTIIFINRMDKENADYDTRLTTIRDTFGSKCMPINIPVGSAGSFSGVVSVMEDKCSNDTVQAEYDQYREMFLESFAETDDVLTEKYLEGEGFSQQEIIDGMKTAILERKLIPILCGSAKKSIGVDELVDFICADAPSPDMFAPIKSDDGESERKPSLDEPFTAQVFKIVSDPYIGQLTYIRVFSGVMSSDKELYNVSTRTKEKVNSLFSFKGKEQKQVHEAFPGEIIAIAKLKNTNICDTFADHNKVFEYPPIKFPKPNTSFAVYAKDKKDDEKISGGLHQISLEDPTFSIDRNAETKELVISGLGDLHIGEKMKLLKKKHGVEANLETPKVAYRETIRKKSEGHCKHKKQSGGRGQFADVYIKIEPLESGGGFEFVDEIVGGVIPKGFIPGIEKGVVGAMKAGVVASCPVQDVRVRLYFGSYHTVDSSELAFKIAGSKAFKDAMEKSDPYLLEPFMNIEVIVTDEFMGHVTGDINVKRGRIQGVESVGSGLELIKAQAPLSEMYRFPTELRSITGGSAAFAMDFSHYEEVPAIVAKKISAAYKKEDEE